MTKLRQIQAYSGVVGVIILWLGVGVSMQRIHLGFVDNRPISYLRVDPRTAILFSVSLVVSASLFTTFAFYVRGSMKVGHRFLPYFLTGEVAQVIVAIISYSSTNPLRPIHTIAAFVLAFSLPLLMKQFTIGQKDSLNYPIYRRLLQIEQVSFIIGIGSFVLARGIAPLGEVLPAIGFHIWILVTTWLNLKEKSTSIE